MGDRVGGTQIHLVIQGPRLLPSWCSNCKGLRVIHWMLCIDLVTKKRDTAWKRHTLSNPLSLEITHITAAQILMAGPDHMASHRDKGGWEMYSVFPTRKNRLRVESGSVTSVTEYLMPYKCIYHCNVLVVSLSAVRSEHCVVKTCLAPFTLSPWHLFFSRKTSCIMENYFCVLINDSKQLPKQQNDFLPAASFSCSTDIC